MKNVVFVVATRYFPQKVRLEDCGERRKTSNSPVRILAELRSWNRRKPHFLHQRTTRIPEVWEPRLDLGKDDLKEEEQPGPLEQSK